jgi:peroxiredoxin
MAIRWLAAAIVAAALAAWIVPPAALTSGGAPTALDFCDANAKVGEFDITLKDANGLDVSLADYKGKVILLNFWATWCPPCRHEIPWFVEFQANYGGKGFAALGVSTDDGPEALRQFASEFSVNYPLLVGRDNNRIEQAYGPIWALPVSVFIGRDGNVCKKFIGMNTKENFEQMILGLL